MDRNDKSCPHKLPNLHVLHKLLQLLPHFNDMVASLTTGKEPTTMPIHLAEPGTRPLLMDSSNPVVKLVIKGRDVHGCIIDGDLCVNVISEATCHDHGITQWEPCLHHPMGAMSVLAPSGRHPSCSTNGVNLPLGLHPPRPYFHHLSCGIMLRCSRPWLRTTNIKQQLQWNMISFVREKTKTCVVMEERITMPPDIVVRLTTDYVAITQQSLNVSYQTFNQ